MKIMIKVFNLTALAVVGAIVFPGAYGNTMHIKSFVDEQRTFYYSLFFYFLASRDHFFLLDYYISNQIALSP